MKTNLPRGKTMNAFRLIPKMTLSILATLFTLNSFAHRAEPFTYGCVTPGQNMTIDAVVVFAPSNTWYQWQFRDASATWKCFINGVNVINGKNFTVSGATAQNQANNAPLLTIYSATTSLEDVLVRVIMREDGPPCGAPAGTVYGGDDLNPWETKYLRLHVFASGTICPPNSYACAGNILSSGGAYYGGFENISYNAATDVYTRNNFGSFASTAYTFGTGNGTYMDINNPYAKNSGFAKNIAPHTGNYQMVVEGDLQNDLVWSKSASVTMGNQYRFDAWIVRVDGTDPLIQLRAGNSTLATVDMSTVPVGTWKLVHGTFTATSNTTVTFAIRDNRAGGNNNFSIDDICLSVCTSCGALPLHQLDLKGSLQGSNVDLKWIAGNEMNTTHFIVERSLDGENYEEITSMNQTGAPNTVTQYNYNDIIQNPNSSSVIYYRIKAMDTEGRYAYSNVVAIRLGKTASIQVWPNPFGDFFNISYNAASNTKVDISIVNSMGRVVKQGVYNVTRGINQINVNDLGTLSPGLYFLRITDKNTNEVYLQKISK